MWSHALPGRCQTSLQPIIERLILRGWQEDTASKKKEGERGEMKKEGERGEMRGSRREEGWREREKVAEGGGGKK